MRYDLNGSFKAAAPWYSLDIEPDTQTVQFTNGFRFPHVPPKEYEGAYQQLAVQGSIFYLDHHWCKLPPELKASATDNNPSYVDQYVLGLLRDLAGKLLENSGNTCQALVSSTYKATNKQTEDKMATYPTTQEVLNQVNQKLNNIPHVMPTARYDATKKAVVFSEGLDETYTDRFDTKPEKLAVEYWVTVYRINAVSRLVSDAHMYGGTTEARMVLAKTNKVLCALSREQEAYVEEALMAAKKAQVLTVAQPTAKPAKPAAAKVESKPAQPPAPVKTETVGEATYKVTTLPRVEPVVKQPTPVKEVTAKDIEAQVVRETAYAPPPAKVVELTQPKVNLPQEIWPIPEHETPFQRMRRARQNLDVARRYMTKKDEVFFQAEFDAAKKANEQARHEEVVRTVERRAIAKAEKKAWETAARVLFPGRDFKFLTSKEKAQVTRSMKPKAPKAPKALKACETTRWQELAILKFGEGVELTKTQKAAVTRAYNKESGAAPAKTKTVRDTNWYAKCQELFGTQDTNTLTSAQKASVTRAINKAAK